METPQYIIKDGLERRRVGLLIGHFKAQVAVSTTISTPGSRFPVTGKKRQSHHISALKCAPHQDTPYPMHISLDIHNSKRHMLRGRRRPEITVYVKTHQTSGSKGHPHCKTRGQVSLPELHNYQETLFDCMASFPFGVICLSR